MPSLPRERGALAEKETTYPVSVAQALNTSTLVALGRDWAELRVSLKAARLEVDLGVEARVHAVAELLVELYVRAVTEAARAAAEGARVALRDLRNQALARNIGCNAPVVKEAVCDHKARRIGEHRICPALHEVMSS